jgi:hypothetical protein
MAGNARADDGTVAGMLDAQRLLMISRLHLRRHELDRWWRFMPAIPVRATVALIALTASCDLPRDANGTLSRVRGGVLRVGVSLNGPWTMRSDNRVTGSEVLLVIGGLTGTTPWAGRGRLARGGVHLHQHHPRRLGQPASSRRRSHG